MRRASNGYTRVDIPVFPTMLVQGSIMQGEGSTVPVESYHTTSGDLIISQQPLSSPSRVPTPPYDLHLLGGHTPGSDKGRMQQNELMELVTKLTHRVLALETNLLQTKKVYSTVVTKLIIKVKRLEKIVKTSKARRRAKIVISDDEMVLKDSSKQGRMIEDIDQDEGITLVTPTKASTQEDQPEDQLGVLSAAKVLADASRVHTYSRRRRAVSTGSDGVSTAKRIISTAEETVSTAGVSILVSTAATKDKGKAIMTESEPELSTTKDAKIAQMLQEEIDAAERQRIAQVHQAAHGFTEDEWENIRGRVEADEELTQKLQAEKRDKYSEVDQAKMLVDLINQRKKSSKRHAETELDHESSKKQKIDEASGSVQEESAEKEKELSEEELQKLLVIVPMEEVYIEALQVKYLIIDWEVYSEDSRREDLVKLWDLVKERFSSTEPTDDKEKELWVELKRLFEPDDDDVL
ncbi:hypothetical protein Tco_1353220 [Tanacetum coccineum]